MRKRDLRLDNHGISNRRYAELKCFCEQYPDWVEELEANEHGVGSPALSGMPLGSDIGDKTSQVGILRAEISQKKDFVDKAAEIAGEDLAKYIIENVCYCKPMWYLVTVLGMPCSESTLYDKRRYFFYILDKIRR